jgi:hypothetical protein
VNVTFLDRAKLQPEFQPHRVWIPAAAAARSGRSIVFVTERRRRVIGLSIACLVLIVLFAAWLVHLPMDWLLLVWTLGVFGGAGAVDFANGGRSGYYEVAKDGSLGNYLGKAKPDLHSMRGMRVR